MKTKTFLHIVLSMVIMVVFSNFQVPQDHKVLFERAKYTMETKADLKEAIDLFESIVKNYPDEKEYVAKSLLYQGLCYEKMGQQQALEMYSDVITKYPQQTSEVAFAKERLNHLNDQAATLEKLAEKHLKKGNELFSRWEYESAIQEYRKAMELNPNSLLALNAQYCIGQSWFRAGNYDLAMETFKKLIEENPESNIAPVTELMIAQVEHSMKEDEKTGTASYSVDENTIISEQGITFKKHKTFVGNNDRITYATGGFNMSPDCRFLVLENTVVPVDGSDAFQLVEKNALRTTYSPTMTKAAFYADSAICVVPVSPETGRATGEPEKLIEGGYKYQFVPSWSPDGKQLVFARIDDEVFRDIYTIHVDNGNLNPLVVSPEGEGHPVWAPSGDKIVFKRENNLWVISENGTDAEMIIENGGYPYFSSDSKWLFHYNWENSHLYSFERNENYKLEIPGHVGKFASFSPDDKKMYFYKPSYDAKWGMKIVSASGGPSFTPSAETEVYGHQWTPDCKKILAQSEDENENIQYKIISLTGGKPKPIKINGNFNGTPFPFAVSPKMDAIIFHVEKEERRKDLYIIPISLEEAKTTGPARLIFEDWTGGPHNVTFSWSPDGEKIALSHEDEIWTVNLKNGEKKQLTNNQVAENWIDWSPDGEKISYLTSNDPKTYSRKLYIISKDGGKPTLLNNDMITGNWSPDSKQMSILSNGEVYIISTENGKILKKIMNINEFGLEDISSPKFSPDGKNLFFLGNDMNDKHKNYFFKSNIESGESEKILTVSNPEKYIYALRLSPDGRWISYLTEENIKVRPEGVLWEAGFEEVKEKITDWD
jgi:Tol biopolymer transport system component/TolA-binding protein